jgi:hypothetical protein
VQIRASITPSQVGQQVTLDVHAVTDPQPTDAQWTFGDGAAATGTTVRHIWNAKGTFPVHVTAVFPDGTKDADADQVVNPLPPVKVPVTVSVTGPGQVRSTPSGIACPPTCSARFDETTNLKLTAQTTEQFDGFGGDCGGPTCQLTLGPGGASVTAHFTNVISNHKLTLHITHAATADGGGIVDVFPNGNQDDDRQCVDSTCTYTFKETDTVDLMPNGEGIGMSAFVRWQGACNSTAETCHLTMDRDRTVTSVWVNCPDPRCPPAITGGAAATGQSSRRQSTARPGPEGRDPAPGRAALPARRRRRWR